MRRLLIVLMMLVAVPCFGVGNAFNGLTVSYSDTTAVTVTNLGLTYATTYGPYISNAANGIRGYSWTYSATSGMFWKYDVGGNDSLYFRQNSDTAIVVDDNIVAIARPLAITGALTGVTTLTMAGALSGVTTLSMSGALSGLTNISMSGTLTGNTVYDAINFSIERPDTLDGNQLKLFVNPFGTTIFIDSIWVKSPTENHDLDIYKRDKNTNAAGTLVDALVAATAITSGYRDLETTISNDSLQHDQEWYIPETTTTDSKVEGVIYFNYTKAQ